MFNPAILPSPYFPLDEHGNQISPSLLIPGTDEELVYIPPQQSPQQNIHLIANLAQQMLQPQHPINKFPPIKQLHNPGKSPIKQGKKVRKVRRKKQKIQAGEDNGQRKVRSANFQETPTKPIYLSPDGLLYQVLVPANTYQSEQLPSNSLPIPIYNNAYPILLNGAPVQTHPWPITVPYQPNPQIEDLGVIENISPEGHPKRRHILKVRRRIGKAKRLNPVAADVVEETQSEKPL